MTAPDRFEAVLRHDLLDALPGHGRRRRRRDRALAATATAGLVVGLAWIVGARDQGPAERISAGPPPTPMESHAAGPDRPVPSMTSTEATSITEPPTWPVEVPGGPALPSGTEARARAVVETFLDHLRTGDGTAAATFLSEYGTEGKGALTTVEAFADGHSWLLSDAAPRILVTPSPGWQVAAPVVTVVAEVEDGAYRAAAFVLSDGLGDPPTGGPGPLIHRLPDDGDPATAPAPGTPVSPGREVTFPGGPTEGGVRTFVDEVEVPSTLHGEFFDSSSFTVPPGVSGGIVVTRSVATPEFPHAVAAWYPVADS